VLQLNGPSLTQVITLKRYGMHRDFRNEM
jgi:hypothetical protein